MTSLVWVGRAKFFKASEKIAKGRSSRRFAQRHEVGVPMEKNL